MHEPARNDIRNYFRASQVEQALSACQENEELAGGESSSLVAENEELVGGESSSSVTVRMHTRSCTLRDAAAAAAPTPAARTAALTAALTAAADAAATNARPDRSGSNGLPAEECT